jgi:hypothetical protein
MEKGGGRIGGWFLFTYLFSILGAFFFGRIGFWDGLDIVFSMGIKIFNEIDDIIVIPIICVKFAFIYTSEDFIYF